MAAGRPLLYIGPREATPARMIQRFHCGWQIDPGDTVALISLLERLAVERHLILEAGERARQAFEQYYDRSMAAARIVKILGPGASRPQAPFPIRERPPSPASRLSRRTPDGRNLTMYSLLFLGFGFLRFLPVADPFGPGLFPPLGLGPRRD